MAEMNFKSFDEVQTFVNKLKEEYNPLQVLNYITVEQYNELKNSEECLPSEAIYQSITYCCKHNESPQNCSTGATNSKHVLPSNCPFILQFDYCTELQCFVIIKHNDKHNHEIGEEIYMQDAENRQTSDVLAVLDMLKGVTELEMMWEDAEKVVTSTPDTPSSPNSSNKRKHPEWMEDFFQMKREHAIARERRRQERMEMRRREWELNAEILALFEKEKN